VARRDHAYLLLKYIFWMGQHIQAKADFQHAIEIIEAGEVTANVSSAGFVADS